MGQIFKTEEDYVAGGQVCIEYLLAQDMLTWITRGTFPTIDDLNTLGRDKFSSRWCDDVATSCQKIILKMREAILNQLEVVKSFEHILPPDCAKCDSEGSWELCFDGLDPTYRCGKCGWVIDPIAFTISLEEDE